MRARRATACLALGGVLLICGGCFTRLAAEYAVRPESYRVPEEVLDVAFDDAAGVLYLLVVRDNSLDRKSRDLVCFTVRPGRKGAGSEVEKIATSAVTERRLSSEVPGVRLVRDAQGRWRSASHVLEVQWLRAVHVDRCGLAVRLFRRRELPPQYYIGEPEIAVLSACLLREGVGTRIDWFTLWWRMPWVFLLDVFSSPPQLVALISDEEYRRTLVWGLESCHDASVR